MNRTVRAIAVALTAATLTLTGAAHTAAVAKPAHAGVHAKGGNKAVAKSDVTKVVRDIQRTRKQIDRAVSDKRLARLADAATVVANAEHDKADLDGLQAAATAADTTLDLKKVRRDVRDYRPENYRLVVNLLRQAAEVGAAAVEAGNTEASALVDSAVDTALTVRATSAKSMVKQARADLEAAQDLLDADEAEDVQDTEPVQEPGQTEPVTSPTDGA